MRRFVKHAALLGLVLLTATACPRQVEVESEPNQPDYLRTQAPAGDIDVVGVVHVGETLSLRATRQS